MIPVADLYPGQWIRTTPNGPPHQVRSARPATTFGTVVTFVGHDEPVTYAAGARLYPAPEPVCFDCGEPIVGEPYSGRCVSCAVVKYLG